MFPSVVCIYNGYETATKLMLEAQKGNIHYMGLGWASEETSTCSGAFVHSDNVVGSPSSLSDERIKDNVSILDPPLCLDFCNALRPAMYLQTQANEPRSGLIAQEVQAALEAHSLPQAPVLDTKMAKPMRAAQQKSSCLCATSALPLCYWAPSRS